MMRVVISHVAFAAFAITISEGTPVSLTLGQDVDWPPYAFRNATTGALDGIGYDIAMGLNALCPTEFVITVVETAWSDCWSSANGGSLGTKIDDGTLDGCMTYTHTQGVRDNLCDFSYGILQVNKPAGLLTLLNSDGTPKVNGRDNLQGRTVVDVGGWAPTADTLTMVTNKCTNSRYSTGHTLVVGNGNDEAMYMLRNGSADAMYVYADQAANYQCASGATQAWNCTNWAGFGTEYAYVQTGQFGHAVNGTTLILGKKNAGKAALVNNCLARYMQTQNYYNVCLKHGLVDECYRNSHFPAATGATELHRVPTNQLTTNDCSTGYCPCPRGVGSASFAQGRYSMHSWTLRMMFAAVLVASALEL